MDPRLERVQQRRMRAERRLKSVRQTEEQLLLGDRLQTHPDYVQLAATEQGLRRRLQLIRLRRNKKHLSLKVMRRKIAEAEKITLLLDGQEQMDMAALGDAEDKLTSLRRRLLLGLEHETATNAQWTKAVARD